MRRAKYSIIGVLSVVSVQPAAAFWPFGSSDSSFIESCENTLRVRLHSHSGYSRQSVDPVTRDRGSLDEMLRMQTPELKAKRRAAYRDHPDIEARDQKAAQLFDAGGFERLSTVIHYDAVGATGEAISGTATCVEYIGAGSDYRDNPWPNPIVNGQTGIEWMVLRGSDSM